MDVEIRPVDGGQWDIVDLFGREVGRVALRDNVYAVTPVGTRLVDMNSGLFLSLDAACVAIGAKVHGRCRLVPSGDT